MFCASCDFDYADIFAGTERLINILIKHNKHFQMLAYPNRSHGIFEGEGTVRHLFESITRFFEYSGLVQKAETFERTVPSNANINDNTA